MYSHFTMLCYFLLYSEVEFPVLYSMFLLLNYFIHISVYMSIPISQFIPPSHPDFLPLVSIRLFSTSMSLFLPCKLVHLYHFSGFHIYALMYDIWFSLSDLLNSVWQSLGPSTSLQMTQFSSFYTWVIFHCIYVPHICLLYPFVSFWTFGLLPPFGY